MGDYFDEGEFWARQSASYSTPLTTTPLTTEEQSPQPSVVSRVKAKPTETSCFERQAQNFQSITGIPLPPSAFASRILTPNGVSFSYASDLGSVERVSVDQDGTVTYSKSCSDQESSCRAYVDVLHINPDLLQGLLTACPEKKSVSLACP